MSSGRADAWIAYRAFPGDHPRLKDRNWTGIGVDGAAYILIEGFEVEGNRDEVSLDYALDQMSNLNNPITSGGCIAVAPAYGVEPEQRSHHVVIRANTASRCSGAGISTVRADYVRIEDKVAG